MAEALFYHLTRSTEAQALLHILPKALQRFEQVELRGTSPDHMTALDKALWLGPEDTFLAHGLQSPQDEAHPIVLCWDRPATNRPCLIGLSHVDLPLDQIRKAQRTCILFDGHEERAVHFARAQWKTITSNGIAAQYWAQEATGWKKKAESA